MAEYDFETSTLQFGNSMNMTMYLLKRVENIVVKGEIAHPDHISLLSNYVHSSSAADATHVPASMTRIMSIQAKPQQYSFRLCNPREDFIGLDIQRSRLAEFSTLSRFKRTYRPHNRGYIAATRITFDVYYI